ncbi:MAG: hypothetical protein IPG97_07110 [Microthrixaceae bacterium]|nr:hypothetical protein [Microthrixaceae bacterium]
MTDANRGFETRQVHAGAAVDPTTGAVVTLIYQTTAHQFRDSSTPPTCSPWVRSATFTPDWRTPPRPWSRLGSCAGRGPDTAVGSPGASALASGHAASTTILNSGRGR